MNNGRLDRALLLAILVALGGMYWQRFSTNERFSDDFARLSGDIAQVSERLARVETHLEYIVPRLVDPLPEQPQLE